MVIRDALRQSETMRLVCFVLTAVLAYASGVDAQFVSGQRLTDPAVSLSFAPNEPMTSTGRGFASLQARDGQLLLAMYDQNGRPLHPYGQVVEPHLPERVRWGSGWLTRSDCRFEGLASDGGGVLVAWNTQEGVRARRFAQDGRPLDAAPVSLSTGSEPLTVVFDGDDYRVVRGPVDGIWQTRISTSGAIRDHSPVANTRGGCQIAAAPITDGLVVMTTRYASVALDDGGGSGTDVCALSAIHSEPATAVAVASDGATHAMAQCTQPTRTERLVLEGDRLRTISTPRTDGWDLSFDGSRFVQAGDGFRFFTLSYGMIGGDADGSWRRVASMDSGRSLLLGEEGETALLVGTSATAGPPVVRPNRQATPVITDGPDGESLVVFSDERSGVWDLYGLRVNTNLEPLGPVFTISSRGLGREPNPTVAFNGETYLVAWSGTGSIYVPVNGTRVSVTGEVLDTGGIELLPGADEWSWRFEGPVLVGVAGGFLVTSPTHREVGLVPGSGPIDPRARHRVDEGIPVAFAKTGGERWLFVVEGTEIRRVVLDPSGAPLSTEPVYATERAPDDLTAATRGDEVFLGWILRDGHANGLRVEGLRFRADAPLPQVGEPILLSAPDERLFSDLTVQLDAGGEARAIYAAKDEYGDVLSHVRVTALGEVVREPLLSTQPSVRHPAISPTGHLVYEARWDGELHTQRVVLQTVSTAPLPDGTPCDEDRTCATGRCIDGICGGAMGGGDGGIGADGGIAGDAGTSDAGTESCSDGGGCGAPDGGATAGSTSTPGYGGCGAAAPSGRSTTTLWLWLFGLAAWISGRTARRRSSGGRRSSARSPGRRGRSRR